jgi:Tfp pilus assembly protein PilV
MPAKRCCRRGLTFAELLCSVLVLGMIASAMGLLTQALHSARELGRSHSIAVQHARALSERLRLKLQQATCSPEFPGCHMVQWTVGSHFYPDTLVVWLPEGDAVDPTGLPRRNELVIYRPHPSRPYELLEITDRTGEPTTVPERTEYSAWRSLVNNITNCNTAERTVITNLLRTAIPAQGSLPNPQAARGVIRFRTLLAPSEYEWNEYDEGTFTWNGLAWPQGRYGHTHGVVQNVCFWEFHLSRGQSDPGGSDALPFFNSTVLNVVRAR